MCRYFKIIWTKILILKYLHYSDWIPGLICWYPSVLFSFDFLLFFLAFFEENNFFVALVSPPKMWADSLYSTNTILNYRSFFKTGCTSFINSNVPLQPHVKQEWEITSDYQLLCESDTKNIHVVISTLAKFSLTAKLIYISIQLVYYYHDETKNFASTLHQDKHITQGIDNKLIKANLGFELFFHTKIFIK